jgi:hypothetical protein
MSLDLETLVTGQRVGLRFDSPGSRHNNVRYFAARVLKVSKTRVTVVWTNAADVTTTDVFTMRNRRVGDGGGMSYYRGPIVVSAEHLEEGKKHQRALRAEAAKQNERVTILQDLERAARNNNEEAFRDLLAKLNSREYV